MPRARRAPRAPRLGDAGDRERDAVQGERIAWTTAGVRRAGEARGIDQDGALVVFTDAGERVRLDAGEVHLVREPAA